LKKSETGLHGDVKKLKRESVNRRVVLPQRAGWMKRENTAEGGILARSTNILCLKNGDESSG